MPDQLTAASRRSPRSALGDRVRQLRVARGLTQTELAGDRFSKEYLSQIERGKTRPTGETIEWIAVRLGVDPTFLETGVSSSEHERVDSVLSRAEATLEAHQYAEVLPILARAERLVGQDFFLGYAPERVDPGNEQYTISTTPKLVAGVTGACLRRTQLLYETIIDSVVPVSSRKSLPSRARPALSRHQGRTCQLPQASRP